MIAAPRLVLITDARWSDARIAQVAELVCAAVPNACVQLRDRERDDDVLMPLAVRLREVTRAHGASFMINRRPELARRTEADGLHADADALAGFLGSMTSAPAHDEAQVGAAKAAGASFVLVSPIYASPGKQPPRGTSALTGARAISGAMGVVALGGIDEHVAAACFAAGAHGVACIRALLDAPDPASTARRIVGCDDG